MHAVNRKPLLFVLFVTLMLAFGVALSASTGRVSAADAVDEIVPGQYIVALKDNVRARDAARAVAREYGASITHIYNHALNGFAARIPDAALLQMQRDGRIESITPDRVVRIAAPAQPYRPLAQSSSQTVPTGITRIFASVSSNYSVPVAVIDTGIDIDHPDLNVVGGKNCVRGGSYDDGNGHGTHVAGTIGARNNTIGVVGVAPGTPLYAVRVLNNQGSGSWSQIICGLDWVTARAGTIKVANMSLGGSGSEGSCTDNGLREAVCNAVSAGITVVVAAGNSAANSANYVPATYPEAITVSALADFNGAPGGGAAATCRSDVDDTFANFSNYGADVDIIAPGVCILSTWRGGGYNTISGTSMASPHVAGAAARWIQTHAGATPAQVKSALLGSGNFNWSNADDGDSTKEPLLDVSSY